jgi:3'-phosphoadenosine 5'-phosphosulfate sulfotransferase (PAPS reductase)/FAD synthetase
MVAAHVAIRWGPADLLVYLDTKTGAESNRRFVERVADTFNVQLWTLRTHESYEDLIREHGFPGPSQHQKMYQRLKRRQLERLATLCDGRGNKSDLHLWTGIRKQESDNRMGYVRRRKEADRWVWHAPLFDWSKRAVDRYAASMNLPKSHLWDTLGRSGDCFCGAYGSPEELIDAEATGCDRLVRGLRNLELDLERDDEKGRWGWAGMSDIDRRAERAKGRDMSLCYNCW